LNFIINLLYPGSELGAKINFAIFVVLQAKNF